MPPDILDWLEPDWVLNTDTGELLHGFFCPTSNQYQNISHEYDSWRMFKDHHYLDANINKRSRCYIMCGTIKLSLWFSYHIT
jgi:hypothetical protein